VPTDVIDAVRLLRRSLSRAAATAFAGTGVGPKQVLVLRELRRAGKASQVELSRATATDPAAMMRAIGALEQRGWVLRSGDAADRRCKVVSLTPAGRRSLRELDVVYDELRSLANGALPVRERKHFCEMAARMAVVLEAAGPGASAAGEPRALRTPIDAGRTERR